MSDSDAEKADGAELGGLGRLEEVVNRLLEDRAAIVEGAHEAEKRIQELQALLAKFSDEGVDPATLHEKLETLRDQNERLRERITEGREGVDKLLSRLRFLESQS